MLPTCLIVNYTDTQPDWVVEVIVGKEVSEEEKKSLIWPIATRYYTAKVQVKVLTYKECLDIKKKDLENIEAVVCVCSDSKDTLQEVDKVWQLLRGREPSVCLLVSSQCELLTQHEAVAAPVTSSQERNHELVP